MITGNDEVSVKVLAALQNGAKVKELPAIFDISLDQAKRLSRYVNMLQTAQDSLSIQSIERLQAIGLKALFLASLFKERDWDGLNEVLAVTDASTKRDELPRLIDALQEKRQRVQELREEVAMRKKQLERIEEQRQVVMDSLEKIQAKMKKGLEAIKNYDAVTQEFLLEHVGVHEVYDYQKMELKETYILIKRLDSLFQAKLKKEKIISYSDMHYVHRILSMDRFEVAYQERRKNKRAGLLWNPDIEYKRAQKENNYFPHNISETGRYKNGHSLVSSKVKEQIKEIQSELAALDQQKKDMEKEIRLLEKEHVQSFIEAAQRPTLSETEVRLHQRLQNEAGKWLYSRGYAVVFEFTLPNNRRVDVAAINEDGNVIFIEVKASRAGYQADQKWREYLPYCHQFYFLGQFVDVKHDWDRLGREKVGFLFHRKKKIEVLTDCPSGHEPEHAMDMMFPILRAASKKIVYGF